MAGRTGSQDKFERLYECIAELKRDIAYLQAQIASLNEENKKHLEEIKEAVERLNRLEVSFYSFERSLLMLAGFVSFIVSILVRWLFR